MSDHLDLLHAFARTLVAFADDATSTFERGLVLRATARTARTAAVDVEDLRADGNARVVVNGEPLSELAMGHEVVLEAMRTHGIRRLIIRRHAGARDIAQMAGLLVRIPTGDAPVDGTTLATALDELRLWGVRLVPGSGAADDALPHDVEAALDTLASADSRGRDAAARALLEALTAVARRDPTQRGRVVARALSRAVAAEAGRDALRAHSASSAALLVALADAVVSADETTRRDALAVFAAAGDAAPVGLISLLTSATTIRQRRRCFDALIAIGSGVPALIAALRAEHWYVVRNVAQLLGELRAAEAIPALDVALYHADVRVRTSAAEALEQIGTAEARAALRAVINDEVPEIRRVAARAFDGAVDAAAGSSTTMQLMAAVDREDDPETVLELVHALGALGSPPAVQRLVRLVGGAGGDTRPPVVRLAALEALVRARGRSMLPTLRSLRQDRDPAIRAAARRLETVVAA